MKRLLVIAIALLMSSCAIAQRQGFKLVETSGDRPDWVRKGSVQGYIIVQADKPTLDQAKAQAIQNVRGEIAASVATKTKRTVKGKYVKTQNDSGVNIEDSVVIVSEGEVANMPAIRGVSITKAETYHEYFRNRRTGETYYNLYVKYPFSQFELVELVAEFEKHEKEINDRIDTIEAGLNDITSIEQIDKARQDLAALAKEVGESDYRYDYIESVDMRYMKIYSDVNIAQVSHRKGKLIMHLEYDGNVITTTQKPRMSSNCATKFVLSREGDNLVVTYDPDYCYDQDDNYVEIRFTLGPRNLRERFYFK